MSFKTALAALLCLSAPLTWAEDERWFQVEVLVFENPAYGSNTPEQWPTYPDLSTRSPVIDIEPPMPETIEEGLNGVEVITPEPVAENRPTPFEPLIPEEQQLLKERAALEKSRGFRILYHEAWMQPVPDRESVIPIRIRGGDTYGQQPELQGYIDLYVERYLHLIADLQLVRYTQTDNPFRLIDERQTDNSDGFAQVEPFGGLSLFDETPALSSASISRSDNRFYVATESVRLQQRRRMRSSELHYLDNPEFGLLILVTPVEFNGNS